jgi:FKBP-type peptidyl-prolyl cis-trans isomerase
MRISVIVFFSVLLYSCTTYSDEDINSFDQEIQNYIEENDLKMERLESGIYINIKSETKDAVRIRYTDQVTFYYEGSFLSGEVFQVIPENEALTYKVKELIAGWQEGLMQLKGPGTIDLIIPPHLGYGTKKTGKIPPSSTLYYTLTVASVK